MLTITDASGRSFPTPMRSSAYLHAVVRSSSKLLSQTRSQERFQSNLLSFSSEKLPESSMESIKAVSRGPGTNSEGCVENRSICVMFVPRQGNKIGIIGNIHAQNIWVRN